MEWVANAGHKSRVTAPLLSALQPLLGAEADNKHEVSRQ